MNNYTEPPFSELFSRVPSSLKYWGVRSDSVKLKFFSSRFFFLIFTFFLTDTKNPLEHTKRLSQNHAPKRINGIWSTVLCNYRTKNYEDFKELEYKLNLLLS